MQIIDSIKEMNKLIIKFNLIMYKWKKVLG